MGRYNKAMRKEFNKSYTKKLFETHSTWKIIQMAAFLILCIGYIDWSNIPTKIIFGDKFSMIAVVLLGVVMLAAIKKIHLEELFKVAAINTIDLILSIAVLFEVGYFVAGIVLDIMSPYKTCILCGAFIISLVGLFMRKIKYQRENKRVSSEFGNVVDLKDLYEDKIGEIQGIILLDEKEVDYDLLNRHAIINHMYNVLCECKPQKQFVISLEGKWGAGKSTILKNVKRMLQTKKEKIVVIDDFDPWMYGTEESIVENFFYCLLSNNDLRINTQEIKKSVSVLAKAVVDSSAKGEFFERLLFKEDSLKESKEKINEYLRLCGKKVIIFIDNLDRIADEKKILFLFKLIGNVLDFEKVIFVVSFDAEVVREILDVHSNIGYSYLEKIIQMQISISEIDKDALSNVIRTSTNNLLKKYNLNNEEISGYKEFVESICDNAKDIRDYKRIINSIVVKILGGKSLLSKRDLLIIEYIKMKNFQLYQTIYNKRKFFVSEGSIYDRELYASFFRKEEYEKEVKEFMQSLFKNEEHQKYEKMLARIFPNVNKFCDKIKYFDVEMLTAERIEKTRGIASAKYFSLYFSETENEFSMMGGEMERYVKNINANRENGTRGILSMMNRFGSKMHREILEALQLYIPEINKNVLYDLTIALIEYYWKIDDSSEFLMLNARRRCAVVIWEILRIIDDRDFDNILQHLEGAYEKMILVNDIAYWFEKNKEDAARYEKLKNLEKMLVDSIMKNKINLYDDQYYHHGNVWGMCRILKGEEASFKKYIKDNCTSVSIFRILYDIMGHSFGNRHSYYFQGSTIKYFFDEDELKKFMIGVEPSNEDEKFVKKVYDAYMENPQEENFGDNGIVCAEEIELKI